MTFVKAVEYRKNERERVCVIERERDGIREAETVRTEKHVG